jgi:transcriptional regulator with XRE-family HTH domain
VQTLMKVVRETILEIPGLGKRIKQAREADPRSLKEIAHAANMSPMNWYRIESEEQALPEPTLRKIEEVLGANFGVKFDD